MSLNNQTISLNHTELPSAIIIVLEQIKQRFIDQLVLIIIILGIIGFIGNIFTFLQPNLRSTPFCIYTLCGSLVDIINLFVNLLPNYLSPVGSGPFLGISDRFLCKLKLFLLVFLPQLSMDLLITSLIDRYAGTFGLTSSMRHLLKLKMVPWLVGATVIISGIVSIYPSVLYDIIPGIGCVPLYPTVDACLYILINGLMTPAVMLILVLLTYRRFKQNRQRVGAVGSANINRFRNRFIATAFTQAFVTSFFVLQWNIVYWYSSVTQYDNRNAEQWTIIYFVVSITGNLYYMINVRSFYLSTLTSRLFRETLITALFNLLPEQFRQRWNGRNRNVIGPTDTGARREERLRR